MGENDQTQGCEKVGSEEEDHPFPLTDVDRWVLSQTDEEFHLHDWDELKEIIATNKLETLKRKPSALRKYISWTSATKAEYGSMSAYILQNRLPSSWGQPPFSPISTSPFSSPSDYRILVNDWPYGLADDITHIVVWSKTLIPVDEKTGDVTEESRGIIEEFVKRVFGQRLAEEGGGAIERVVWFKNWVSLQSVRTLEHVHVLVRGASKEDLKFWTGEPGRLEER
ncbi:hypothetical protein WAI453_012970 [Rhynchosporium graminicola]|uniref:N-acetylglucosamine-induced protein 1 n=1 Tax=Rhynchosporium graminicola TaxID=2792576 RepID=A0A1E1LA87_9HELO|nr:uncharacterized protein RCO7_07272 [Rhynchosporium commune]